MMSVATTHRNSFAISCFPGIDVSLLILASCECPPPYMPSACRAQGFDGANCASGFSRFQPRPNLGGALVGAVCHAI
jgi:hypothetical protein